MKIYRLRPYQDARKGPTEQPSLWRRFWTWINTPPKAPVFKIRDNPSRAERIRRKARESL